jgi:hypothetical protein
MENAQEIIDYWQKIAGCCRLTAKIIAMKVTYQRLETLVAFSRTSNSVTEEQANQILNLRKLHRKIRQL